MERDASILRSAASEPAPYVSPPSLRGMAYTAPSGYRHHHRRSWFGVLATWPVMLAVLVGALALVAWARADRLVPWLRGTTVTRVQPPPELRPNPFRDDPTWGPAARPAGSGHAGLPARLPPTSAGPIAALPADSGAAVRGYRCTGADGSVSYGAHPVCAEGAAVPVTGPRIP